MHLKYRPETWEEVIGNSAIKKSLKSLTYKRHILLHGTRGCGKTTLAYLVAKSYGANPVNIDVINCGVNNDVGGMRERIEKLNHSTIFGNKKVLILDEIHLLSNPAKEALLLPLEEDTSNFLIIACTTEPSKLPGTLYDRFLDYKVQPLNDTESLQLLTWVCEQERITLSKELQLLLIEKVDGNPRRLLKGLTKVRDTQDIDEATYLLDIIEFEDDEDILNLFKLILLRNTSKLDSIKGCLSELLKTKSPDSIRIGLMNIVAGHMMSAWFKTVNKKFLCTLYDNLMDAEGVPDKANLIHAIIKSVEL